MIETETQTRLRRAKEALSVARDRELTARKALNDAIQTTARLKEQYGLLFLKEEKEECARRMKDRIMA